MRSIISIGRFVELATNLFRAQRFLILALCGGGCWESIFRQDYFGSRRGCLVRCAFGFLWAGDLPVYQLAASIHHYFGAALVLRSHLMWSLRNYTQGVALESPAGKLFAISFGWPLILEADHRGWCCKWRDGSFLSRSFLGALGELSLLAWRADELVIIKISNGGL